MKPLSLKHTSSVSSVDNFNGKNCIMSCQRARYSSAIVGCGYIAYGWHTAKQAYTQGPNRSFNNSELRTRPLVSKGVFAVVELDRVRTNGVSEALRSRVDPAIYIHDHASGHHGTSDARHRELTQSLTLSFVFTTPSHSHVLFQAKTLSSCPECQDLTPTMSSQEPYSP